MDLLEKLVRRVVVELGEIKQLQSAHTENLKEHMRRTDLLEKAVDDHQKELILLRKADDDRAKASDRLWKLAIIVAGAYIVRLFLP